MVQSRANTTAAAVERRVFEKSAAAGRPD